MVTQRSHSTIILAACLVLAACSDGVSPDAQLPFRGADYLWPSAPAERRYDVQRDGTWYSHAIVDSGDGRFTDLLFDNQANILARTQWSCSPASGKLHTSNQYTLWHLPPEYRLSEQLVSMPGPVVSATCILPLDANNLLAGTVADGIFHYNAVRGDWYSMAFPGRGMVTALCKDSTAGDVVFFAGTAADGMFSKSRFDSSWVRIPVPAGSVGDIESSGSDFLYAVIDRRLWFARRPYLSWASFSLLPGNGEVNDIAILPVTENEEVLLIATESSGIAYVQLYESMPVQLGYSERSGYESIRSIAASAGAPYVAVGISDPPFLFVSPQAGLWVGIPFDDGNTLHCVAQSPSRGTVLVGSNAGIYRFDGNKPALSGLPGKLIRTLRASPDGTFYAGAEDGFYRSRDDGRTWTRIDGGSVLVRVEDPWQLLPTRFAVGVSWQAATLVGSDGIPFAVTGRVMHHFDELILPDNRGRYENAIAVRFARESAAGEVAGQSYMWMGYFVRGKGLVYIEESRSASVVARTFSGE